MSSRPCAEISLKKAPDEVMSFGDFLFFQQIAEDSELVGSVGFLALFGCTFATFFPTCLNDCPNLG